jgi:DNA-binding GntR family transcriptional regulator
MLGSLEFKEGEPLHEQVYRRLSDSLMQGDLAPGQQLTLRALAESLGTSVMPVREAVRRLATQKAVQILPKRYILVEPLTAESYLELVDVRKLIEGRATARACELLSEEEIRQIAAINDRLMAYAERGMLRKALKENQHFHFAIYQAARSRVLLEIIESLWVRVGPSLHHLLAEAFARDSQTLHEGFANHQRVIDALGSRDAEAAMQYMRADLEVSEGLMLDALKRQFQLSRGT